MNQDLEKSDTWGKMDARTFNAKIMPIVNHKWAAKVLGMKVNTNTNGGPDLVDDSKGVELKFSLVGKECSSKRYTPSWNVEEHQTEYGEGTDAFWGLGTYRLNKPVEKIVSEIPTVLERMVLERTLWIVHWDWMFQFPPSETSGKTKHSSWERTFRYPKMREIPPTIKSYEVEKGLVHLTEGVDPLYFSFLETGERDLSMALESSGEPAPF